MLAPSYSLLRASTGILNPNSCIDDAIRSTAASFLRGLRAYGTNLSICLRSPLPGWRLFRIHLLLDTEEMFRKLLATTNECHLTVLRITLGIMILPHGLQKTFGLFGGSGFSATMASFERGHIPAVFAFLAIMAEFLGGIGLLVGLFTRIAAFGVACNMAVAIFKVHLGNGFFMNWSGKQRGEGIEFHVIVIAICVALMIRGGGSLSADRALFTRGSSN